MRLFKVFITLIVVLLLVFILSKNLESVNVDLLFAKYDNVSVAVLIIATLSVGILVGFGIALMSIIASKAEVRSIRDENKRLSEELTTLRNLAIDEGFYEGQN